MNEQNHKSPGHPGQPHANEPAADRRQSPDTQQQGNRDGGTPGGSLAVESAALGQPDRAHPGQPDGRDQHTTRDDARHQGRVNTGNYGLHASHPGYGGDPDDDQASPAESTAVSDKPTDTGSAQSNTDRRKQQK